MHHCEIKESSLPFSLLDLNLNRMWALIEAANNVSGGLCSCLVR